MEVWRTKCPHWLGLTAEANIKMRLICIVAEKREQSFMRARLTVPNRFRLMRNRSGQKNWNQAYTTLTGFITVLWLRNVKGT